MDDDAAMTKTEENNGSTLLLLDYNNIFYQGVFVHKNLTYRGKFTGGIYGFLSQTAALINAQKPERVVLCVDHPPYLREKAFAAYKADRMTISFKPGNMELDSFQSDLRENRKAGVEISRLLGFDVLSILGLEADDLIAQLARRYARDFDRIVAVSNDTDLYQLLDQPNLLLLRGVSGRARVGFNKRSFLYKYPELIEAEAWAKVLALTGGHNNVGGLPGVGVVRAAQWVTQSGPGYYLVEELLSDPQNLAKYEFALEMAVLPYPKTPKSTLARVKLTPDRQKPVKERELVSHLGKYGVRFTGPMEAMLEHMG